MLRKDVDSVEADFGLCCLDFRVLFRLPGAVFGRLEFSAFVRFFKFLLLPFDGAVTGRALFLCGLVYCSAVMIAFDNFFLTDAIKLASESGEGCCEVISDSTELM